MNRDLIISIENSKAHRPIRDHISGRVFEDPNLFIDLIQMAFNPSNPFHYKACWVLELVMEKHIDWLEPHLSEFCLILSSFTHNGALRSISKICLFASKRHLKTTKFLSRENITIITECCFDWLISDQKVATKAYAMRTLFEFGKTHEWIYPELQTILVQDAAYHSAAYKAAGKDILRRINRISDLGVN